MPLYGRPMLSTMLLISFAGINLRIVASTRSHSAAVSSMRVPVRARKWSLIWPESTLGKKSWPSPGRGPSGNASSALAAIASRKTAAKRGPLCRASLSRRRYFSRIRSKPRSKRACRRASAWRRAAGACCAWARSQNLARVGTSVRDSTYDASIANTTASARGMNRYLAIPTSMNIGRNTMQMDKVDTRAGRAIWRAPSRIAVSTSLPCSRCQLMFSIVTVASSTRMPTASASPPRVMMLMVWPSADRQAIDARMDSGIEIVMISVLRQLPRNRRISSPVRAAAIAASRMTPEMAARTKIDWSLKALMCRSGGSDARTDFSLALMPLMMSIVDALPVFRTLIRTARWPFKRTMLVCGE